VAGLARLSFAPETQIAGSAKVTANTVFLVAYAIAMVTYCVLTYLSMIHSFPS
jgi:hypothetical protein